MVFIWPRGHTKTSLVVDQRDELVRRCGYNANIISTVVDEGICNLYGLGYNANIIFTVVDRI